MEHGRPERWNTGNGLIDLGRGASDRGARGAVRQNCCRSREPARKETTRGVLTCHPRRRPCFHCAYRQRPVDSSSLHRDIHLGQRAATTRVRAVEMLRWLEDAIGVRALARDAGVSQATAYRYRPRDPGGDRSARTRPERCPGQTHREQRALRLRRRSPARPATSPPQPWSSSTSTKAPVEKTSI